jgi:hypothetical protein
MTAAAHATPLESWRPPPTRAAVIALAVGAALMAACAIVGVFAPRPFFQAYLFAFLFWWTASMGCLGLALLHNLTGGAWGTAIRPFLHAGMGTVALLVLLFVPLVFGFDRLYWWMGLSLEDAAPGDEPKAIWFNFWFVLGRVAVYFLLWLLAAAIAQSRARRPSAVILAVLVLTASFAAVDWAMSLERHWFSTIYGGLYVAGALVVAMALSIVFLASLAPPAAAADRRSGDILNDLGNLLLAFIMIWAYFSFSQFLIIWSGNLPEENIWYIHRSQHGWGLVAAALALLHFAAPFLLLLSRDIKRNPKTILAVAGGLVFMRSIDLLWVVAPSFQEHGWTAILLDFAALVGLGGIWIAVFVWRLKPLDEHARPHGKRGKRKGGGA